MNEKETDIENLSGDARGPGKALHIFYRTSGEPAWHIGSMADRELLFKVIGQCVAAELDAIAAGDQEGIESCLESYWMTDEEVENLPEL